MARHRNVRGYNYDEDFEEDDLYGHSVDDDYCISPSTAAQFIYSRRDDPPAFVETLEEECDYEDKEHSCISSHELTGVEKAQLEVCLKHMREVLEESVPEKMMMEAALNSKFNVQQALDSLLAHSNNQNIKTKNQDTVIAGKTAKGLLSEIYSSANKLSSTSESLTASFSLSDPIVGFGMYCDPSAPSDKILLRPKYVKTPSAKQKTLAPSCNYLGAPPLQISDNHILFHDSVNNQASLPYVDDANPTRKRFNWTINERSSCSNSWDDVLKSNPSEKGSWNHSESEDVQDLKTLMKFDETGDSADAQDIALIFPQKKSDYDSINRLDNPGLMGALADMMLDNKTSNKFTGKMEHIGHSLLQKKGSSPKHNSSTSELASLRVSMPESPSLADLLQEHQSSNSNKKYPLSDCCNQSITGSMDVELGYSPLSQLASQPQSSSRMAELSGSLSSLTFSRASPVKELESLSLSDLIANSIEVVKPEKSSHSDLHVDKMLQPAIVNSDIDLSVLIRKSALAEHTEIKSDSHLPETDTSGSLQGQQISVAKGGRKSRKRVRSHILESVVPWTKSLSAKPSAFAITLCLHYPPKRCKHRTVSLHKAFLYSRQMQEVKINETGPLLAITPFDFKSPSPDDIVKSGQKKAFTR